jgi:hypothetical protein
MTIPAKGLPSARQGAAFRYIPFFKTGRLSGNPEFHPALSEKKIAIPPPCLEVVPGLRSLGKGRKSDFQV